MSGGEQRGRFSEGGGNRQLVLFALTWEGSVRCPGEMFLGKQEYAYQGRTGLPGEGGGQRQTPQGAEKEEDCKDACLSVGRPVWPLRVEEKAVGPEEASFSDLWVSP